jgi:hypothetical protein
MNTWGRVLGVSAVVALSAALVGCDPAGGPAPTPDGDPMTDPTPSVVPTPSVEPTPRESPDIRDLISTIVIDGDSVYITISEGGVYLDVPFTTDPETAVAQLSEAIRLPAIRSTIPSSTCFNERPQATWGGISFIWGPDWQRAPGQRFLATASAAATSNGIPVTILGGQWIGTSESEVMAGVPGAYSTDYGAWTTLHYDVAHGDPITSPEEYWGAIAILEDGVLTSFSSPVNFFFDC